MRLSFRQGIVQHQTDTFNTPTFLLVSGGYVSLIANNAPTVITFAQGDKDYLYTERRTMAGAWGPFSAADYWLYWQLDGVTGARTFGATNLEPVTAPEAPTSPGTGQMWFNTNHKKMYEFNGASWIEVIRVFACKLVGGVTPISVSINSPDFRGTQVGLNVPSRSGELIFDLQGKPIRASDRQFFNTEDQFFTGVATGARLRVGNILVPGVAEQPLHKYQVVEFIDFNRILPASPFTQLTRVYGIIEEDAPAGDVVDFVTEGMIYNEDWDWMSLGALVNDPVYIDDAGEIQIVPHIGGQMPIGVVTGIKEIYFAPRLFSQVEAQISFDTSGSYIGTPASGQFIWHYPVTRELEIIDSASTDHHLYVDTPPIGGDAIFELYSSEPGGAKVSRGTFEVAAGSNVATSQNITTFSVEEGDVLHLQCVTNFSVANVSLTLKGNTIVFWRA